MILRPLAFISLTSSLLVGCGQPERAAAPAPAATPLRSQPVQTPTAALPSGHPPIDDKTSGALPDNGAFISGAVDAAPAAAKQIAGGALYLIARNAKTHQILAVRREDSLAFPVSFRLSGADAMAPGTVFEGPLDVTARWSRSGDAMPASGDIEGTVKGVDVGKTDVRLTLSDVRP